ncbi:DUF4817 domain-containing protein [Trichonephila clavipes]|nr:DUF4817 domain-containing protein [Trichonephila clavipes]
MNHKKYRLARWREYLFRTEDYWGTVLFSDESRFSLDGDERRVVIWREPKSQYRPSNNVEKNHYGQGGFMVKTGIITEEHAGLHVFEKGTITDNLVALHFKYDQARRRFVEWAQNEIAVVPDIHKRILFSDEAHFWLNGYVKKQNCRIWSEANPQVYVETPLHPEKLTVWCALWAGGIIGPYFFKNDEGHNVTVNGDRYRAMITNFFIPELNNHDVQELWFQQDGATCHTARATIDLLKDTFGDRLISRFGPVNWPPRSCDLTPLDYFL